MREFKVEATVGNPQVSYKETIKRTVQAEGRYVRQTGGHGQYGHCVIELAPLEPGQGYVFENKIVGGVIPKEYIPAIDNGIKEAAKSGLLGGFEVVDFKATLLDGSYHDVDSSEMAYKIAGSMAFKEALAKAAAGEDFDALIETYGEDTGMLAEPAKTRGYLVCEGLALYEQNFQDAAMALANVGDVSTELVETSYGYHILQYTCDIEGGAVEYTDEIKEAIHEEMLTAAQDAAYDAAVTQWVSEAKVETFPKVMQ